MLGARIDLRNLIIYLIKIQNTNVTVSFRQLKLIFQQVSDRFPTVVGGGETI